MSLLPGSDALAGACLPTDHIDDSTSAQAIRTMEASGYNFSNHLRMLETPEPIRHWSPNSLQEKLIEIGAKVVTHGRYIAFQMSEIAIPRSPFCDYPALDLGTLAAACSTDSMNDLLSMC